MENIALSELPEIKTLRRLSAKLPAHYSPQERIAFLTRPLPGSDGKDPITLVCEGRTETLTAALEDLHKPFWKRLVSKLIG